MLFKIIFLSLYFQIYSIFLPFKSVQYFFLFFFPPNSSLPGQRTRPCRRRHILIETNLLRTKLTAQLNSLQNTVRNRYFVEGCSWSYQFSYLIPNVQTIRMSDQWRLHRRFFCLICSINSVGLAKAIFFISPCIQRVNHANGFRGASDSFSFFCFIFKISSLKHLIVNETPLVLEILRLKYQVRDLPEWSQPICVGTFTSLLCTSLQFLPQWLVGYDVITTQLLMLCY